MDSSTTARVPGQDNTPATSVAGASPDLRSDGDAARNALLAQNWWAIALRGLVAILFGIVALMVPGAAMLSLALVFAAYLVADGILGITAAVRAAHNHQAWGLLLAEGALNLLMGMLAAFFPVGAVLGFVLATAAWALITGGLMLGSSFRLKADHGRWWLAAGGVLSLLWGVLLVVAPLAGALVLTWWLGGYALAFGAVLMVLAFRLRDQHRGRVGAAVTTHA